MLHRNAPGVLRAPAARRALLSWCRCHLQQLLLLLLLPLLLLLLLMAADCGSVPCCCVVVGALKQHSQ
jgi:hypothetical protein